MWQGRFAVASLIVVALLASLSMCAVGGGRANQLEVYSWWTGPGEEEGLNAMAKEFEKENPGVTFVNAAVSGGAGSNAKAILASRLLANDPPDSYQRHAGLELLDDVRSGKVQDLSSLYDQEHWRDVFPKGLLDDLTISGKVYAVPVNIHRANLMWYLPSTLKSLGHRRAAQDLERVPRPGRDHQEQGQDAARDRARMDPEAPAGDRPARRARPGRLREALRRADQLDVVGGRVGPGRLHQGAAGLRPQVGGRRLATPARQGRAGLRGVRGDGRLDGVVPGERQEADVPDRLQRGRLARYRRHLRLPVRLVHAARPARAGPTWRGTG